MSSKKLGHNRRWRNFDMFALRFFEHKLDGYSVLKGHRPLWRAQKRSSGIAR